MSTKKIRAIYRLFYVFPIIGTLYFEKIVFNMGIQGDILAHVFPAVYLSMILFSEIIIAGNRESTMSIN